LAVTANNTQQVLSKTHQATGASAADEAPRVPYVISDEEINKIFGDVLKGRPQLPVSFTLFFQPGTSILASSGEQIDQIIAEIQRRPISAVSIYGHAGETGNITLNLGVALLRARSVSFALASRGLDRSKWHCQSKILNTSRGRHGANLEPKKSGKSTAANLRSGAQAK
jgi:outer membrane protein OmpA-like peptidoglycan-associated protein